MTVLVVVECMGWERLLFSFCLFDAGPWTDKAVELVETENAEPACEEPDIDRIEGVTDRAEETLRDTGGGGAGVFARPAFESVRGR